MGIFDDAVNKAVPDGNLAKPLMIAAGALILGHLFGGKHEAAPADSHAAPTLNPAPASGGFLEDVSNAISGALGSSAAGGGAGGHAGGLGGILGGLANSPLGGALTGAAAGTAVSGGLESLLNQFRSAGHGAAVDSWVGEGENHPIAPDQINSVLGEEKLAAIAQQAGLSPQQMSQLLAQALPTLISKLTPGGQIPQG